MNAYDKAAVERTVRDCLMVRPYSTVREIARRIDESPSRVYTALRTMLERGEAVRVCIPGPYGIRAYALAVDAPQETVVRLTPKAYAELRRTAADMMLTPDDAATMLVLAGIAFQKVVG